MSTDIRSYINLINEERAINEAMNGVQRLNELAPLIAAAGRFLIPMLGAAARQYGPQLAKQAVKYVTRKATKEAGEEVAAGAAEMALDWAGDKLIQATANYLSSKLGGLNPMLIAATIQTAIELAPSILKSIARLPQQQQALDRMNPAQVTKAVTAYLSKRQIPNAAGVATDIVRALQGKTDKTALPTVAMAAAEGIVQAYNNEKSA